MDVGYETDQHIPLLPFSNILLLFIFFLYFLNRDVSRGIFQRLLPHDQQARLAFKIIEIELGFIYDLLYTKANAIYSSLGIALRIIAIFIISIVLVLFLNLEERHHHSKIDVIITLVLVGCRSFNGGVCI